MRLQPLVRARLATLGDAGAAWQADLPVLVEELAQRWHLTPGRSLPGGTASYVFEARTSEGRPRVVKVGLPGDDLGVQVGMLTAADGRGYVRLYDADLERRALLLEALGPSLEHRPLGPEEVLATTARTLGEAWSLPLDTVPAVAAGDDKGADKAEKASTLRAMVVVLAEKHPDACDPRALDQALAYADQLVGTTEDEVVVHGDPHAANLLRTRERAHEGFVLIDANGFRADPAYDLGVAVRDWCRRLEASDDPRGTLAGYCRVLAEHTGIDVDRIWAWGFLERVSTGLYVHDFGGTAIGRRFLDSAARLVT